MTVSWADEVVPASVFRYPNWRANRTQDNAHHPRQLPQDLDCRHSSSMHRRLAAEERTTGVLAKREAVDVLTGVGARVCPSFLKRGLPASGIASPHVRPNSYRAGRRRLTWKRSSLFSRGFFAGPLIYACLHDAMARGHLGPHAGSNTARHIAQGPVSSSR